VVLLHGFPDCWFGWERQIEALAGAGYRVIAPDQRGYNLSEKPRGVRAYRLDTLVEDVRRLADEVAPRQRFHLVGHDWGAFVAWWVALRYPVRLTTLAILNVPHPVAFQRRLRRSVRQLLKSWYVFACQPPWLPEWLLGRNNFARLEKALRRSGRPAAVAGPATFSDRDLTQYRAAWAQPGALSAMLNWYRAAVRYPALSPLAGSDALARRLRVTVPTLILWGVHDVALEREMAMSSAALCKDGHLVFFEDASHWVHRDEANEVNARLLGFLGGVPATRVPERRP
jgi:epoxide hydrolase 4